jgi:hypothetical protein
MTARAADRLPKRRVALLVLVALAVSAAAASATAVALGSRSDLSSSRKQVDASWARLRPALETRYAVLGEAATVARARLNDDRAVFGDIDRAAAAWRDGVRAPTDRQVAAAADLEGLAARLATMVAATPRLRAAPDVTTALERLRSTDPGADRDAYNAAVRAYERARGGFPRRLVAGALGYEDRRRLEVPI